MRGLTPRQSNRVRKALRYLMAQRYPTQCELAEALGISQQAISAVLAGRTLGGMKLARCVASALGWELDVLLNSRLSIEPPESDSTPAKALSILLRDRLPPTPTSAHGGAGTQAAP